MLYRASIGVLLKVPVAIRRAYYLKIYILKNIYILKIYSIIISNRKKTTLRSIVVGGDRIFFNSRNQKKTPKLHIAEELELLLAFDLDPSITYL